MNDEWRAHRLTALLIRATVVAVPLSASAAVGFVLHRHLPAPGSLQAALAWGLVQVAAAIVTLLAFDRLMRMLLPLATLLSLSLAFPGQVPRRFGMALRANSTAHLRRRIEALSGEQDGGDLTTAAMRVLELLAALSRHDRWTRGHSERVRAFNDLLIEEMGLPKRDRDRLRWAALLHDIGKLEVPSSVLRKPAALSSHEWEVVKRHPMDGARLVAPLRPWLGRWAVAVEHHHEHFDGSGYPLGLAGSDISLGGRMLAVADAFEVMITSRPYKRPVRPEAARQELVRCAGTQFDPAVVRAFLTIGTRRLRRAMGPMALLAEVPFVGVAPRIEVLAGIAGRSAISAAGAVAGAGALAAVGTVGALAAAPAPPTNPPHSAPAAPVSSAAPAPGGAGTQVLAAPTPPQGTGGVLTTPIGTLEHAVSTIGAEVGASLPPQLDPLLPVPGPAAPSPTTTSSGGAVTVAGVPVPAIPPVPAP